MEGNTKQMREGEPTHVFVKAHAKINLYLRVLAREESGFHGIETVFQRIALHDEVRVSASRDRVISCSGPSIPREGLGPVDSNLAWRAARLYMDAARRDDGFHVDVIKHIPVGGGLGGGSADAAAVLRALDTISSSPLGPGRLSEIAAQLGSDVPFLLTGWPRALAWGRGTHMLQLTALPRAQVTLLTFSEGVNTGDAYRALAASRTSGAITTPTLFADATLSSWQGMASIATNDFEPVVSAMHEGVRQVLHMMRTVMPAGMIAMMSGSGATCFVLHDGAVDVDSMVSGIDGVKVFRSHTM